MHGWVVDDLQLAQRCPFCDFLVVPRLHYELHSVDVGAGTATKLGHGQCEYVNPMVLRKSCEQLVETAEARGNLLLEHGALHRESLATYLNLLWFTRRLRLPLFLGGQAAPHVVHCAWLGPPAAEQVLEVAREHVAAGGSPHRRLAAAVSKPPPYSTADQQGELEPTAYVVNDLAISKPLEAYTMWASARTREALRGSIAPEPASLCNDKSTPLGVACKVVLLMEKQALVPAVRLFLSARMASRGDESNLKNNKQVYHEYDGHVVCRGWEHFSNSVYIELYALAQASELLSLSPPQDLELERALLRTLQALAKSDPTLGSYIVAQDYPPPLRALAFRTFFPPLC
jgi:hypothetical protein